MTSVKMKTGKSGGVFGQSRLKQNAARSTGEWQHLQFLAGCVRSSFNEILGGDDVNADERAGLIASTSTYITTTWISVHMHHLLYTPAPLDWPE